MAQTQITRRESYEATLEGLGLRQKAVYAVVEANTTMGGATAWEIAEFLRLEVYVVRPRLTELQSLGVIESRGTRYHAGTDRKEAVWFLQKEQPKFDGDQGVLL